MSHNLNGNIIDMLQRKLQELQVLYKELPEGSEELRKIALSLFEIYIELNHLYYITANHLK